MTNQTRSALSVLGQIVALLAVGLGALLAYTHATYVCRDVYAQDQAAIVGEVADVRTTAAGTTEQLRGDVREIRAQLAAQGRQLDRIERIVEQALARPATSQPATRLRR